MTEETKTTQGQEVKEEQKSTITINSNGEEYKSDRFIGIIFSGEYDMRLAMNGVTGLEIMVSIEKLKEALLEEDKDDCDCSACKLRRKLESKEKSDPFKDLLKKMMGL